MTALLAPASERVCVFVNGKRVGALCGYRERRTQELCPVEAIGAGGASALHTGRTAYEASIRFIILEGDGKSTDLSLPPAFTLEIRSGKRKIQLKGCEYTSFETCYETGEPTFCEVKLRAVSRTFSLMDREGEPDAPTW